MPTLPTSVRIGGDRVLRTALRTAMAYPFQDRVTSAHAGWTSGAGEHSHVAVSYKGWTFYLCGISPREGNLVWGENGRHNVSCGTCKGMVRKATGIAYHPEVNA